MKLKVIEVDGKTYALVEDGMPVYEIDGKDTPYDVVAAASKVTQLNGEAMGHRKAKEAAEEKLKAFEGIEDPKAAKAALDKIKALGDKELLDAGKVEEIKAAAVKAVEDAKTAAIEAKDNEIKTITGERDTYKSQLDDALIGGSFSASKFVSEKTVLPPDFMRSHFGKNFRVDKGKILAFEDDGTTPIYSSSKPGELADFEDAISKLVSKHPQKEMILKGTGNNGSGSQHGQSGGGGKTITRSEFDRLSPVDKSLKMKDGFKVVDQTA